MVKVLFFVTTPFSKRDYDRYGIDIFLENGLDIQVWDLTFALYPDLKEKIFQSDVFQWEKCIVFNSKSAVLTALRNCPPQTIIINPSVDICLDTLKMYRLISKQKIPYIRTPVSGSIPPLEKIRIDAVIQRILKAFNVKKLLDYLLKKMPLELLGVHPATFVIAEGFSSQIKRLGITKKTKIIRTHSLDYDIFLKIHSMEELESKTAVFLDSYLPYHPDYLFTKERPIVTPDMYYPQVCNFFDFVEKKYGLEVIIASHPRAKYEEKPFDLFQGRSIIKGKTAELVQQSKIVFSHGSTALSFAVLFKKPVLFIMTNEIYKNNEFNYRKFISDFALCLDGNLINVSENFENIEIGFEINEIKYEKYLNDRIKMKNSPVLPHWKIVCNSIVEHFEKRD